MLHKLWDSRGVGLEQKGGCRGHCLLLLRRYVAAHVLITPNEPMGWTTAPNTEPQNCSRLGAVGSRLLIPRATKPTIFIIATIHSRYSTDRPDMQLRRDDDDD